MEGIAGPLVETSNRWPFRTSSSSWSQEMIAPVMPEKNRNPAVRSPAQRCSLPNIALIVRISLPAVGQLADGPASLRIETAREAVAGGDIAGIGKVGDVQ